MGAILTLLKVCFFSAVVWANLFVGAPQLHMSFWTVFGLVSAFEGMMWLNSYNQKVHRVAQLTIVHNSLLEQIRKEIKKLSQQ